MTHDDEVFGDDHDATTYDVVSTDRGLIAVGQRVLGPNDPDQMRFVGTVWTSPDGLAWTRLKDEDGTLSVDGQTCLTAVTDGPSGLVTVGEIGPGDGSTLGAVGQPMR